MAHAQTAAPQHTAPRLYIVTPAIEDAPGFASVLAAVLGAADIAAVLLRLADADERTLINRVKALAPVAQQRGVALLLDGRGDIAVRGGADGAHLTGVEAFTEAVERLKPQRIAGCGGLHTRHDAMLAGERGADYVMFGEPREGRRPSPKAVQERVQWWAEVFEVPCVGYAGSLEEVAALAGAQADFIALGDLIWSAADGPAAAVADAARALAPETVS